MPPTTPRRPRQPEAKRAEAGGQPLLASGHHRLDELPALKADEHSYGFRGRWAGPRRLTWRWRRPTARREGPGDLDCPHPSVAGNDLLVRVEPLDRPGPSAEQLAGRLGVSPSCSRFGPVLSRPPAGGTARPA